MKRLKNCGFVLLFIFWIASPCLSARTRNDDFFDFDSSDLRGSILEIKLGFCETSNEDKTNSLSRKRVEVIPDFIPPSGLQGVSRSTKDTRAIFKT